MLILVHRFSIKDTAYSTLLLVTAHTA